MHEDAVASPADEFSEAMDAATDTTVQISEITDLTLFRIEIDPDSEGAQRMTKVLGTEFPRYSGEVNGDALAQEILYGTRQVVATLNVEPHVFLVVSRVDPIKLGRALDTALGNHDGFVVDVSANRAVINLSGSGAPKVLDANATFEDASPKYFEPGMAFRVRVGDSALMLWKLSKQEYLMVPRKSDTAPFVINMLDAIEDYRS
ncbi:hypothetical protein AB0O14_17295 [Microbacterium foliorum]|jgi:sarcosine oxidase subunit gamma|uniref:hypothetical protein n=1 Tax=Rothia terrae TaxID=396015 RepID=UPI0014482AD9|nr:hypothetical protein [Rothia terrae]NKZ34139.1 hypothetical protein [Rothia terrae]